MPFSRLSGPEINLDNYPISLDTNTDAAKAIFVSHAHMDHIPNTLSKPILSSELTAEIISLRKNTDIDLMNNFNSLECSIQFLSSPHAPGARMLSVSCDGGSMIYTGDICHEKTILGDSLEIKETDVLVIDATYGKAKFVFPPRNNVYNEIIRWSKKTIETYNNAILFGAYSYAKAQELTKLLATQDIAPVVVHKKIFDINQVCERHGYSLGDYYLIDSPQGYESISSGNFIGIVPPMMMRQALKTLSLLSPSKIIPAMTTGWGSNEYKCFKLSSHADFKGTLSIIEQIAPKKVFTFHGHNKELAKEIKKRLGIEAQPLEE